MRPSTARDLVVAAAVGVASLGGLVTMAVVFTHGGWVVPGVLSVGAALLVAAAARATGLPAAAALLLGALGLVAVQSWLHLPEASLLPWSDELRALRDLGTEGLVAIRDRAAPAEPVTELVLLMCVGAWTVTHVAHELAVRLRAPGVALVPIATLWVVPLAMPRATTPPRLLAVPFIVAAALLLLLESDADLVGWVRERAGPRVTGSGVAIAAGAVTIGVVAPWLLPGFGQAPVLEVGTGRNPRGYQPLIDIGDRLSLPIDRAVLRVRSDRRTYLRLAALDTYDDNIWRVGPSADRSFTPDRSELFPADEPPLPFEVPIATASTALVDVEVLDLENTFVPTPYQPVEVTGPDADEIVWSRVGGFLATGELSTNEIGGTLRDGVVPGFSYQVVAAVPEPTIADLRAAEPDPAAVAPLLELPGDPARWAPYADLAGRVFADAGATTTVDRVLALQDWFTDSGEFTYSVRDVDRLRGSNALETFLFETRTGYCEYFSTAMAVMLRAAGIPARTAVGFLPGEVVDTPADGAQDPRVTYEVSTDDAHAWVEVLFPGQGWITFEPTPRSDGATLQPDAADLTPEIPVAEREDADAAQPDGPDAPGEVPSEDDILGRDGQVPPPGASAPGTSSGVAGASPTVVAVAALLVLGGGVLLVVRRRASRRGAPTGREAVLRAQRRVLEEGERLGVGRRTGETTTELLHRWAAEGRVAPTTAAALAALTRPAAFGRADAGLDGAHAGRLADEVVTQLRGAASRRARLLAPVRVPVARGAEAARRLAAEGARRFTP